MSLIYLEKSDLIFFYNSRRGGSPSKIPIAGSYLGVRGSSEDLLAGGRRLQRQVGVTITRLGVLGGSVLEDHNLSPS